MNRRRIPFLPLLIVLLLAVAGVGGFFWQQRNAVPPGPLAGADVGGAFSLVNGDGQRVTDAAFAGKYRLMYFGYTFCPDVCPVDAQNMALGLKAFEQANPTRGVEVVPIFVTVDPARDTPAVVKQFAAAFHPRMVGLTGSQAEIDAVKKTFRVYSAKRAGSDPANYLVDHSAMVYLFGPAGEPISFVAQPTPETVTAELEKYVR
jgi:protein SCO1/2